jgi:hypothetical protein
MHRRHPRIPSIRVTIEAQLDALQSILDATVACMRKLLTILNVMVKTGQHWDPELT